MTNEEIARSNATQWCRCFKCDGIIRDSNIKCNKDKLITCTEWYDGYRTALMACRDKDQQFKEYLEKKRKKYTTALSIALQKNLTQEAVVYDKMQCLLLEIINELFEKTEEVDHSNNDE